MNFTRKTKIVATIGPASERPDILRQLVKEGINAARLNLSHGSHAEHSARIKIVRQAEKDLGSTVAVIADLQGPKIRIGKLPELGIDLIEGDKVVIDTSIKSSDGSTIPLSSPVFRAGTKVGARVLIDDGLLSLDILKIEGSRFQARVYRGGRLTSNKGVNVPTLELREMVLEKKDRDDMAFAKQAGVDYIGLSFIRSANDIKSARRLLKGSTVKIIAKVERPEALNNLSEIINEADAIMVARGDLGIETPIWALPVRQKEIISAAHSAGKPVIVATQMLDSMIRNPMPTRAEVSDVANAVYDGADAVMLSGESASGSYPIDSVIMMRSILEETEKHIPFVRARKTTEKLPVTLAMARAAKYIAFDVGAKFIFAGTASGQTVLAISHFRPTHQIIALTSNRSVAGQLSLAYGVTPLVIEGAKQVSDLTSSAFDILKKYKVLKKGERVVFVSGLNLGQVGDTTQIGVISVK